MVPSQFLSVVLEEDNGSGSDEETHSYSHQPTWQNQYAVRSNNSISDQEMWNLTKNLPKALLAECTVEISRTPVNPSEKPRKLCFDARVSPFPNFLATCQSADSQQDESTMHISFRRHSGIGWTKTGKNSTSFPINYSSEQLLHTCDDRSESIQTVQTK
ncbi:hypothetical protein J6590_075561 [Homalodisca vitripennis]|nr:hypothetical protein J6590_075561 [Homalodisca vitripennis]